MAEGFLTDLARRGDTTDLLWVVTKAHLALLPPSVEDAAYRVAVLRWFDANLVAATLGAGEVAFMSEGVGDSASPDDLYQALSELPFVEVFPKGHRIHSATRELILDHLWHEDPDFLRAVSSRGAGYFGRFLEAGKDASVEDVTEYVYHLLVTREGRAIELAEGIFYTLVAAGDFANVDALLAAIQEQVDSGRTSKDSGWFLELWRAKSAIAAERNSDALDLASSLAEKVDAPIQIRGGAARMAAEASLSAGNLELARSWYEKARNFQTLSTDGPLNLTGLAKIALARNQASDAVTLLVEALDAHIHSLVAPGISFDSPGPDDSSDEFEQEPSTVQLAYRSPNDWNLTDDGFWLPVFPTESDSDEVLSDWWPVNVDQLLVDIWYSLAVSYGDLGRLELADACVRLACDMALHLRDLPFSISTLQLLYEISSKLGVSETAKTVLDHVDSVLSVARYSRDEYSQAKALLCRAALLLADSKNQEARDSYEQAHTLAVQSQWISGQVAALEGIARLDWVAGKKRSVRQRLQQALALLRQAGMRLDEAAFLLTLGDFDLFRHLPGQARRRFDKALAIYEEVGVPSGVFDSLMRLSDLALNRSQFDEAATFCERAILLSQSIDNSEMEASALASLASVQSKRGVFVAARASLDSAQAITERIGNYKLEADIYYQMGDLAAQQRHWSEAEKIYTRASDIYRTLGRPASQISAMIATVDVLVRNHQIERGVALGLEAASLAKALGERILEVQTLHELAIAYSDAGRHGEAVPILQELVRLDPTHSGYTTNLGWILYQAGEYERSIHWSERALELDPTENYARRNLGHAYLALNDAEQAKYWYGQAIERRHEGEHFIETIEVLQAFIKRQPNMIKAQEFVELFKDAQRQIESESQ